MIPEKRQNLRRNGYDSLVTQMMQALPYTPFS